MASPTSERLLTALVVAGVLAASAPCRAQDATAPQEAPATSAESERTIEDLNLIGAAVTMPGFSDTDLHRRTCRGSRFGRWPRARKDGSMRPLVSRLALAGAYGLGAVLRPILGPS